MKTTAVAALAAAAAATAMVAVVGRLAMVAVVVTVVVAVVVDAVVVDAVVEPVVAGASPILTGPLVLASTRTRTRSCFLAPFPQRVSFWTAWRHL